MKSSNGKSNLLFKKFRRFGSFGEPIFCIIVSALLSGCLYFHTRATGIEPQAKNFDNKKYAILGEAEGQSSSFNLLWIIPVTPRINYDKAVSQAIESRKGDNLIEVRSWKERQIWILGFIEILYVRGKVILYER
jgi:hypothetical protein